MKISKGSVKSKKVSKNKRIYLFGFFGRGYLTDEWIRDTTEAQIKSLDPNARIMSRLTNPIGSLEEGWNKSKLDWVNENVDLVIFAGGTLLGSLRCEFARFVKEWNKKLKVPYVIYGEGFRSESVKMSASQTSDLKKFVHGASMVGLRGPDTLKHLQDLHVSTGKEEIVGCSGMTWERAPSDVAAVDRMFSEIDTPVVAVNVCDWSKAEIDQMNQVPYEIWVQNMASVLNSLWDKDKIRSILFPMTLPWITCADQVANIFLGKLVGSSIEKYDNLSIMMTALSKCKYTIATRLHVQLASLAMDTPFLPLEYQFGKLHDALGSDPGLFPLRKYITSFSTPIDPKEVSFRLQGVEAVWPLTRRAVINLRMKQLDFLKRALSL